MDVPHKDRGALKEVMDALVADGSVELTARGKYIKPENQNVTGVFTANARGFGFVTAEGEEEDIFIPATYVNGALHKDVVKVKVTKKTGGEGKRREGMILKILERGCKTLVGTFQKNTSFGFVLPDDRHYDKDIFISKKHINGAKDGDKVVVRLTDFGGERKKPEGAVIEILGAMDDPATDVTSIVRAYGIEEEFPKSVIKEAQAIPQEITEQPVGKRADFRDLLTVTIDGEDARDLDDAISIEKIEKGYRLYVHIADVSHYVQENTALDKEAYHRGTSVYVVDRVVPMLPHALCNGICSLNPHVDRLTITCMMEIDRTGNVMNYRIFPSVINSNERMTYTNVNKILSGDAKTQKAYPHLLKMCLDMKVLAGIIRRRREGLGAIDFDSREAKILVDEKGKPKDIVLRERGEAERIIEDFMIAANETVATHMKWLETPSMYRIHEAPEPKKMREFARIAKTLGYTFKGGIQDVHPKQLQALLDEARGQDNYFVLSSFMLRSMQKARYDNRCLGHFGLGLKEYLHFTSPIRRYPDLIVHRMLRKYIFTSSEDVDKMKQDEQWCEQAAIQASERERNAVDAERAVDDMKKAEYMENYIGQRFAGVISGITKFGMFVELDNTVEGLVHISSMEDDYYHYDEVSHSLIGEHTANVYRMGQKVQVRCIDANRFKREVDFALLTKKRGKRGR